MPESQGNQKKLEEIRAQLQDSTQDLFAWLDTHSSLPANPISPGDMDSLERRFLFVRNYLSGVIIASVGAAALCLRLSSDEGCVILLSIAAGILGSGAAALRSALDRRANGFADKNGNAWPDPNTRKGRFSEAMSHWFLLRPLLGAVTGPLAYWGTVGGVLGCPAKETATSPEKVAFLAALAGLFAKSLLDLLQRALKDVFKLGE